MLGEQNGRDRLSSVQRTNWLPSYFKITIRRFVAAIATSSFIFFPLPFNSTIFHFSMFFAISDRQINRLYIQLSVLVQNAQIKLVEISAVVSDQN
jgi:hypothetical protein